MNILKVGFQKIYKLPFKFYWLICKLLRTDYVYSIYGVKLSSNFTDQTFRFCLKGTYGYQFSSFLQSKNTPFIFLDVGANQGLFSLIAARNTQCRHIWAFEPVEKTYELLKKNIFLNNLSLKVSGINKAISETDQNLVIGLQPNHSGGASLLDGKNARNSEVIHCMTGLDLNDLIDIKNNEQIVIKIDTEGYEPIVVAQLKLTKFWNSITYFYIEIDENRHADKDVVRSLINEGFTEILRTSSDSKHYDILLHKNL